MMMMMMMMMIVGIGIGISVGRFHPTAAAGRNVDFEPTQNLYGI
jgi:hypothetical protein